MFIALDGIDGCGKSTQSRLLAAWMTEQGRDVWLVNDPGTTDAGKAIREVLLHKEIKLQQITQMLLFTAARSELAHDIVKHLEQGGDVVSDRWLLSTIVYPHHIGGVDRSFIEQTYQQSSYGLSPDLTIVIDLEVAQSFRRKAGLSPDIGVCGAPSQAGGCACKKAAAEAPPDRFEREPAEFRERLRQAYLREVEMPRHGSNGVNNLIELVEGAYSPEVLHGLIKERCASRIPGFRALLTPGVPAHA